MLRIGQSLQKIEVTFPLSTTDVVQHCMVAVVRKMIRCMATTARILTPTFLEETKLHYQRKIKIVASKYNIAEEFILKFDETLVQLLV